MGCIIPFTKKSDLEITKNKLGITVKSKAAKIYYALLLNRIEPEIEKIIRKNENGFRRNQFTTSQILTICPILEKKSRNNSPICRFLHSILLYT